MSNSYEDRFLRETEILKMTGISRTTRWRLENRGEFPKRYKISDGITAYKESEILEWIESREFAQ